MKMRKEKGITLVALVITIIVLIILAAVSIRAVMNDGIIINAQGAKEKSEEGKTAEREEISSLEQKINSTYFQSEYQAVEYLESTGTQYIDTGITVNKDSEVRYKTELQYYETLTHRQLMGGDYGFSFGVDTSGLYEVCSYWTGVAYSTTKFDKIEFYKDSNRNIQITINNNLAREATSSLFEGTKKIYLFSLGGSSGVHTDYNSSVRIKNFYIYKDGILIRNYIPCYRKIDNVAGMYDLVNGEFYENAGEGEFGIGGLI